MAAYNKFFSTVDAWLKSSMNFSGDTFKAFLSNTIPLSSQRTYASSTEIVGVNGYLTGGTGVTITTSNSSGTETVFGTYASPTWVGSGGSFGPFQYVIFYDSTTANNLSWFDYGSPLIVNSGDTFTLVPGSSNVLFTVT